MQDLMRIFLAVLLAHLIADFLLQTDVMAAGKRTRKLPYLQHGLLHLLVLLATLAIFTHLTLWSWRTQLLLLTYVVLHIGLDIMKSRLARGTGFGDSTALFLLDQALHLATIGALVWFLNRSHWIDIKIGMAWSDTTQLHILTTMVIYVGVIFGGGYFVRHLTRSLTVQASGDKEETTEELRNAGLYIGWLERFLVLTAVVVQSPAMIGLILTGKSIARFPEMKGARFAEYFLIGTFLSISLALAGGIALMQVLFGTVSLK